MFPFSEDFDRIREQTENFDIAISLFLAFSRFEYALKRAGFTRKGKAEANLDKFCSKYKNNFSLEKYPGNTLKENYLLEKPPNKQILDKGHLCWEPIKIHKEPIIFTLNRRMRQVRNNLFHGEKFHMILHEESPRNVRLVESSLQVIIAFLELNEDVKMYFYRGMD